MDVLDGIEEVTAHSYSVEDPTQHDHEGDPVVVTTRRGLSRIAFVAAETGARFEREGIDHDPVAWMMTPREIFDGSAALDACLERHAFMRAAILHGLSWGLDASPRDIDPLIADDDDEFEPDYMEEAFMEGSLGGPYGRHTVTKFGHATFGIPAVSTPVPYAKFKPTPDHEGWCGNAAHVTKTLSALSARL